MVGVSDYAHEVKSTPLKNEQLMQQDFGMQTKGILAYDKTKGMEIKPTPSQGNASPERPQS